MAKFMSMGSEDMSLHDRLYQYYQNRRNFETLDIQMLIHESVDFYFPLEHLLVRIDPQRTLSLNSLRKSVAKYLKRHLTFAEESFQFAKAIGNRRIQRHPIWNHCT